MNHSKLTKVARGEVRAVLASLPADIRSEVERIPIFLERKPDSGDLARGIECDTLGLYDEGAPDAPTPRIRLWLANLWELAEGDVAVYRGEVHTTLLHEIGHHLGWDEEEVEERGLG